MGETLSETPVEKAKGVVIELLDPPRIEHYWGRIEEELLTVPHLWEDRWRPEHFFQMAMSGHSQIWAVGTESEIRLVAFTQVNVFPVARMLWVSLVFGQLSENEEALDKLNAVLEGFAITQKCVKIEGEGRLGWERKLRKFGAIRTRVVVSREVRGSLH